MESKRKLMEALKGATWFFLKEVDVVKKIVY